MTSTTAARVGALALAALALVACDADRRAIDRTDLRPIDTEPDVVVEVSADGFDPDRITVAPDTLLLFVNVDADQRGVRSTLFDTGLLLPDEFTFVVVDSAGTYELVERTDPELTATLVVEAAAP